MTVQRIWIPLKFRIWLGDLSSFKDVDIRKSIVFYCLCKEENITSQVTNHLDLYIKYWSSEHTSNLSLSSFSIFEAEKMVNEICKCIECEGLPLSKMIMLSMDGPNINKSLFLINDFTSKVFRIPWACEH